MAPKPSFKVKLSKGNQENNFPLSVATTWVLSGSEAEGRLQAKAEQGGFDSSFVQKSHLRDWNPNICDTRGDGTLHTASFAHGMPPTPQSPTNFNYPMVSNEVLASNSVERTWDGWMGSQSPLPLTPVRDSILLSPISLFCWPKEAPSSEEFEAANVLLSLSASSRTDNLKTGMNDEILVGLEAQSPLCAPVSPSGKSLLDLVLPADNVLPTPLYPDVRIPQKRKARVPRIEAMLMALGRLREARISLMDLLFAILSGNNPELNIYRRAFLSDTERIGDLLNTIWEDKKSRPAFEDWMTGVGVDHVCKLVGKEMEAAKPLLKMNLKNVSPEYLEQWDVNTIMEPVAVATPTWSKILYAASEPRKKDAESGDTRNRPTASCKIQICIGLVAWATGASRRMIDILHQSALTMSYTSTLKVIESLSEHSLQRARDHVSRYPHGLAYDNINISTSIFVEQREYTPNKVQSGTFPVVYELLNANPAHMKLGPMIMRFQNSSPLTINNLRPSEEAMESFLLQTSINIAEVLFKYVEEFSYIKEDPCFRHPMRRAIPKGYKTKFHCLRASTIEEASVQGNLLVHDDVYRVQLKLDSNDPILNDQAIPTFNDQLTNSRIRGAQASRIDDISLWEQRLVFQISLGLFHLLMNFNWSLLASHRGAIGEIGSLSHFFAVLDKTRLGGDQPDFHTLKAALMQILEGLLLNAWQMESGFTSLQNYAKSQPTAEMLLKQASNIIRRYATPECRQEVLQDPSKQKGLAGRPMEGSTSTTTTTPQGPKPDNVYANVVLLTRDLLYVMELINAISAGDFGRVKDILPDLACMFRGASSNNYSTEILHLIFNLKEVWTPEFGLKRVSNIMRDNMLVNPSGLEGHAMAIDMNIEHLIHDLKELFVAKGVHAQWDRLAHISACASHIQSLKKHVSRSVKATYQGSTHSDVDTKSLGWRVANKSRDLKLQIKLPNRTEATQPKLVVDLRQSGWEKFGSSSLTTFNKKIEETKGQIAG